MVGGLHPNAAPAFRRAAPAELLGDAYPVPGVHRVWRTGVRHQRPWRRHRRRGGGGTRRRGCRRGVGARRGGHRRQGEMGWSACSVVARRRSARRARPSPVRIDSQEQRGRQPQPSDGGEGVPQSTASLARWAVLLGKVRQHGALQLVGKDESTLHARLRRARAYHGWASQSVGLLASVPVSGAVREPQSGTSHERERSRAVQMSGGAELRFRSAAPPRGASSPAAA